MSINSLGAGAPIPQPIVTAQKAEGEAAGRSVSYPRVDEDALARRIFTDEYERTPGGLARYATGIGIGAGVLGGAGVGLGLLQYGRYMASNPNSPATKMAFMSRWGMMGVAAGALVGAGVGWYLNRSTPDRAREYAAQSLDFTARSRPPIPPASAAPAERIGMPGVVRDSISGSTVGGIVQLKQTVMGDVTTSSTTVRNEQGEPTIQIGNSSGQAVTTSTVIRTENATLNSVGLGRVLYDPNGYGSMSEATQAYDGKHAAAIVKEGDRYLLVDVDAESWSALADRSFAMSLADDRVKAVFANKGVYYPSTIADADGGPRLFLFAQEQDIERTIPTGLRELDNQPIGTYETNAVPGRNEFAERFQVHVRDFYEGDEYSGPGFSDRAEAIQHMVQTEGQQGLLKSGNRYYVAHLDRRDGTGNEANLHDVTHETPQGSAVLGLRTNDRSEQLELIEDEGGLYAPVDDWWLRVRTAE